MGEIQKAGREKKLAIYTYIYGVILGGFGNNYEFDGRVFAD